ncbi:LysR family transcriptional regulator [Advenella sp. WQ 585]|uniref:LysR family transcriptional regulator n=1 Tax=Advenella mandrilli TaxID=2800330 RepID=A0ABS1EBF8_9BURK|nr:LysR family transcriptional regulator [Advenella mandrilli]MBK1780305.1 LysR family transcriptional regulator [Advenella mandrilli]
MKTLDWDGLRYFLEVARTQRVSAAAVRLGVEHTTVARRIRQLETQMDTLLFDKSRSSGFVLTAAGHELLAHVEQMESHLFNAREKVTGVGESLSGHIRVAATEGFGSYIITPLSMQFQQQYPDITLDVLPVPRFVSLTRREADIAITIERPLRGPYVCSRLCDYSLRLYGTREYLQNHPPIRQQDDLKFHSGISYVEELIYSDQLRYLEDVLPLSNVVFKSTSIIAQYYACLQGQALAILPCFMAAQNPHLVAILPEDVHIQRSFWMYFHEDLKRLRRMTAFCDFVRSVVERNSGLMKGTGTTLFML